MRRVVFALLSSAVLAAACSTSRAEIGVADIVNPNSFLRGGGPTMFRGFRFSIDTQIAVTALGFFDYRGNGLDAPTPTILISLDSQTLLAQLTLPAGSDAELESASVIGIPGSNHGFRFGSLDQPAVLAPGQYAVASFVGGVNPNPGDILLSGAQQATFGPHITNQGGWSMLRNSASDLGAPFPIGVISGYRGDFGPNFRYVVPSPATGVPLAAMTMVLIGRRGRKPSRTPGALN